MLMLALIWLGLSGCIMMNKCLAIFDVLFWAYCDPRADFSKPPNRVV
jgi:hypothetical protein